MNHWLRVITGCWLLSCVTACGAADENGEPIVTLEEELGTGCDIRAADQTFVGKIDPKHVSPPTYGGSPGFDNCYGYYIVDVTNLASGYAGGEDSDLPAHISAGWATAATTRAACEATWAEATFYRRESNKWVKQGASQSETGLWYGPFNVCFAPDLRLYGLLAGKSYRTVVTARQGGPLGPLRRAYVVTRRPTY
jgi:hypothetical protein